MYTKKLTWWSSLRKWLAELYLVTIAFIFSVVGVILLLLPSLRNTLWQTIGGALLGAGFTIFIAAITARQSSLELYRKDANLQRKTDVYGPLHAELKILRKTFDEAHTGKVPYPRWIEITGVERPSSLRFANTSVLPTLYYWPNFKTDYRIDNFSPDAQKLLNEVERCAVAYGEAVENARTVMQIRLIPHIAASVAKEEQLPKYQEWLPNRFGNLSATNRWFDFIQLQVSVASPEYPLGEGLAQAWSVKIGWLLTGNSTHAALDIYNGDARHWDASQHASLIWFQNIFEATAKELESDPTYQKFEHAQKALYNKLLEAETVLYQGLIYILNRYEGGPPLV